MGQRNPLFWLLLNSFEWSSWEIFYVQKGSKAGGPFISSVFVQGSDLLQSLVNIAFQNGTLSLPIPVGQDFPIIQYADDTIVVLPADVEQLKVFKGILEQYAAFTGLRVNFHKSSLIPINLCQDEAAFLSQEFLCQLGTMPSPI
jgi:hypothetical protein